ncbi:MAG: hypothetical protein ACI8R4_003146 [Paracoccaceae bacterium]|jgi:hypothetical protein
MKKLLREPVLHFALLGIALFAYFSVVNQDRPAPNIGQSDQIVISQAQIRQFIEQYRSVWRRPPTPQDLTALVDGAVREEILVREALALGLDRGDAAIRNRLKQKMQFLTDSAAQMMEPSEAVLHAHMAANPGQFSTPPKAAFDQIYLGQTATQGVIDATLTQLAAGDAPQSLGRGSLLPPGMPLTGKQQVDSTFGTGFFATLAEAEPGTWFGPVRSGYGVHLVRVSDAQPATLAEFAMVRDKVLFEWRRMQADELAKAQMGALRQRYRVQTPDADALQQALSQ